MLKNRLIPCIIVKDDLVVQSFNFKYYLPIGKLEAVIEFFVNWDVDEIIILDISRNKNKALTTRTFAHDSLFKCFIPVTIGGGINSLSNIERALNSGADKVSINSALYHNPKFVREASDKYGSSCITGSVDVRRENGEHIVYVDGGNTSTHSKIEDYLKLVEDLGVGEVFLNSIDNDGARKGYDIDLLKKATNILNIPVIACGGVGKFKDLAQGITEGNCQAVSAANIFQHTEHSTIAAKSILKEMNLNIRLNSDVKYSGISFDNDGRLI